MKMKNRILSPMDGTIKKINVKPGIIVPKNEVLIELV
jgi:biotin carboxyl carrier protein